MTDEGSNSRSEMNNLDYSVLPLPIKKGQWCDADERMFQACFVVLGQYVENELGTKPGEFEGGKGDLYRGYRLHSADIEENDPSGFPAAPSSDRTAIDLWLWYQDELPALEKEYAEDINECYSGEIVTEDAGDGMRRIVSFGCVREPKFEHDYPEVVKDEKLRALIDLRRALWT